MGQRDIIREIAKEVLDSEEQQLVEKHIAEERTPVAAIVVLGGIDKKVHDHTLEQSAALNYYAQLGLSEEDRLRIRANDSSLWEK